jgi:hypothetical protein
MRAQKREPPALDRRRMMVWAALELLETLVDDSCGLGRLELSWRHDECLHHVIMELRCAP